MIKNEVFVYKKEDVLGEAGKFFVKACGFDTEKQKHRKMLSEATELLDREKGSFEMKAICSELAKDAFHHNMLTIAGNTIACNYFGHIDEKKVTRILIAMVTAGDFEPESTSKSRFRVYMDTWGTAFADSAKTLFEEEIRSRLGTDEYLSNPFGPGYYGIPSSDIKKLVSVIDTSKIGVSLNSAGLMIPLKSIAAIYFVTSKQSIMPPVACSECFGKTGGCRNCSNYISAM